MPFRVRLNNIEYYVTNQTSLDPPFAPEPGGNPQSLPIIRIFGATETGQKVCAHVHGVFPYLYIEYPKNRGLTPDDVGPYLRRLRRSIDSALSTSFHRGLDGHRRIQSFVASITLVKGVPFYGYNVGWRFYCKIYLFNPRNMSRLRQILQKGAVMGTEFQPYEAHIQYILQFMVDFNLYGCGFVEAETVRFRGKVPCTDDVGGNHLWHDETIPPNMMLSEAEFPRQSRCELEVDIMASDVMNRRDVKARMLHHDFIERMQPIPKDIKLVHSMAELWKDESRRRGVGSQNVEGLVSTSEDPREERSNWMHEEELRERITEIIHTEKSMGDGHLPRFETFVQRKPYEGNIMTAFQSVGDFFPRTEMNPAMSSQQKNSEDLDDDDVVVDVDLLLDDAGEEYLDEIDLKILADSEDEINGYRKAKNKPTRNTKVRNVAPGFQNGISNCAGIGDSAGDYPPLYPIPPIYQDGPKDIGVMPSEFIPRAKFSPVEFLQLTKEEELDDEILQHMEYLGLRIFNQKSSSPDAAEIPAKKKRKISVEYQDISEAVKEDSEIPAGSFNELETVLGDKNGSQKLTRKSPASLSHIESISRPYSQGRSESINSFSIPSPLFKLPNFTEIATTIHSIFGLRKSTILLCLKKTPPHTLEVIEELDTFQFDHVVYQEPFYGKEKDIPVRPREYAGREFKLKGNTYKDLPLFDPGGESSVSVKGASTKVNPTFRTWEIAEPPLSRKEAIRWLEEQKSKDEEKGWDMECQRDASRWLSQIEGPTQKNKHGFKYSQNKKSKSVQHELQHMSLMSLEIHVNTRGKYVPDPEKDPITAIFWCVHSTDTDREIQDESATKKGFHVGILAVAEEEDKDMDQKFRRHVRAEIQIEVSECDLITSLVDIVRDIDPDILTGYEVHSSSWGYVIERARKSFEIDLCKELSRVFVQNHSRFGKDSDPWGYSSAAAIQISGRHIINIWRAMKGELNLLGYTMENVVFHLLHKRVPHYSYQQLTRCYESGKPRLLTRVLEYYIARVKLDLEILERQEFVTRTSEQARLLGVDFCSVFSRGSQFKVESLMFRIAKPESFMLVSPDRQQVGGQNALECLPLVLEPESNFYTSPVIVLDFQSLYPSVMIAYNYCYSTFLGRIIPWRDENKMGFTKFERKSRLLELVKNHINVAPNGMMYVKSEIRKSLLAKMLGEILDTRVMVKNGMKQDKDDKILQQLLNNRQLALKLIANVTYGYTSASFSGRMPCAEIADSIVQTGRETLEKAIDLVNSEDKWRARVVYGDTDSLFVHLPGRTKDQAFDIGEEIAARVTAVNPNPIKLKFEKVYLGSILLAKKRYVGFKYEHRNQKEPIFDAKGIETVRRDGTPAQQKIEETALKILFRTQDLSQVKEYCQRQWDKIMREKVSIQDFCFAKEVKLGSYAEGAPPPPGARLAAQKMAKDPRNEPQYGERYPFVVIAGSPGQRLGDRVVEVEWLLHSSQLSLDHDYYIKKNIVPPLERIFNLVGANVMQWYIDMPKFRGLRKTIRSKDGGREGKYVIEDYLSKSTSVCAVCKVKSPTFYRVCQDCWTERDASLYKMKNKISKIEKRKTNIDAICRSCSGLSWNEEIACDSQACHVYYSRVRQAANMEYERGAVNDILEALEAIDPKELEF